MLLLVDLDVIVDGDDTVRRGHDIAHDVKEALLNSELRIQNVFVHVEPDEELAQTQAQAQALADAADWIDQRAQPQQVLAQVAQLALKLIRHLPQLHSARAPGSSQPKRPVM